MDVATGRMVGHRTAHTAGTTTPGLARQPLQCRRGPLRHLPAAPSAWPGATGPARARGTCATWSRAAAPLTGGRAPQQPPAHQASRLSPCRAASGLPLPSGGTGSSTAFNGTAVNTVEAAAWLRLHPPFNVLKADALQALAAMIVQEVFPRGRVVQRAGEPADSLIIVRSGTVTLTSTTSGDTLKTMLQSQDPAGFQPAGEGRDEQDGGDVQKVQVEAGPGASFNFSDLLLGTPVSNTIRASTRGPRTAGVTGAAAGSSIGGGSGVAVIWRVPRESYMSLAAQQPGMLLELGLTMSQLAMKEKIEAVSALQDQASRERFLAPYRVTAPTRGVVGNSRYAERLRKQIVAAARDPERKPVIIFGEPGLAKSNFASLVHFGSKGDSLSRVMVKVDCATMDKQLSELFGRGQRQGVLARLGEDDTVLVQNIHLLDRSGVLLLRELLEEGTYQPAASGMALASMGTLAGSVMGSMDILAPPHKVFRGRVLMTAEKRVVQLEALSTTIQVPPLRVRAQDIDALVRYFLNRMSQQVGAPLVLTDDALRQLKSYNWPGNTSELQELVRRAAVQGSEDAGPPAADAGPNKPAAAMRQLDTDVFWFAEQRKDRLKVNLLDTYPPIRALLRSDIFPGWINVNVVRPVFAVVVALLFLGPQDRAHNFALNFFWDWWWPLIFVSYIFFSRVWCAICPFMVYGEWVQAWRTATGASLMKWPRELAEKWGGWFLLGLFGAILVWEEVWDLPNTAYLSSWLLLLITGGAVVCSYFFEKRLWCRYLCPIGGMNGLMAKLSLVEVRSRQGVCASTCNTYHCYKGGPAEAPEGLATDGCPLHSHPAQLTDNKNCVMCMECLKACPHRSVEVRLRLPGVDLWSGHKASWAEVWLMLMLQGAVYLHHLPLLTEQFGFDPALWENDQGLHIAVSAAVLAAPSLLAAALHYAGLPYVQWSLSPTDQAASGGKTNAAALLAALPAAAPPAPSFVEVSYGYLPLVFGSTLAHYEKAFMEEAGLLLPVAAGTFGLGPEFADALPTITAHPAVTAFVQGSTLLATTALSLLLTRRLGTTSWASVLPQCVGVGALALEAWYLIMTP